MCSPLPGDQVVVTKNNLKYGVHEYFVHRLECNAFDSEETLPAVWTNNPKKDLFVARIAVQIADEPGSVAKVLAGLSSQKNNILSVYFRNGFDEVGTGKVSIEFTNLEEYQMIEKYLLELSNVVTVRRIVDKKADKL
jgi:(p)ppGpp synthase/HD superfamily hydrolase